MKPRKRLTGTNSKRTLVYVVDATAKRLIERMEQLERDRWKIDVEIDTIKNALTMAGVKPEVRSDPHEARYVSLHPFSQTTLTEACKCILKDYGDRWLTKSEIEYLVRRGGYKSSAKDRRNSAGIILSRLATDGFCQAERKRGASGNRYRYFEGDWSFLDEEKAGSTGSSAARP